MEEIKKLEKKPVPVQIYLTDGTHLGGDIFIEDRERITDLLNDERNFIPLRDGTGAITAISKRNVLRVFIPDPDYDPI